MLLLLSRTDILKLEFRSDRTDITFSSLCGYNVFFSAIYYVKSSTQQLISCITTITTSKHSKLYLNKVSCQSYKFE